MKQDICKGKPSPFRNQEDEGVYLNTIGPSYSSRYLLCHTSIEKYDTPFGVIIFIDMKIAKIDL